ncbi:unnamed protein product [Nezara viridula]|uniref:Uncharacterized protein n=1 Tax=Nezara viridula TaxID=85310 RepID=A0A9P0HSM4_NEZVI|nr:unnamed protein product [Nezara viridula]
MKMQIRLSSTKLEESPVNHKKLMNLKQNYWTFLSPQFIYYN